MPDWLHASFALDVKRYHPTVSPAAGTAVLVGRWGENRVLGRGEFDTGHVKRRELQPTLRGVDTQKPKNTGAEASGVMRRSPNLVLFL